MSRRLSRIGRGVGPYLQPAFVLKLKCDEINSLNLHCNNLRGLEVYYGSSKEQDGDTEIAEKGFLTQLELSSFIKTHELTLLVDLDVSSNKLGGDVCLDNENSNNILVGSNGFNAKGVAELEKQRTCVVSLLLLAPNLKSVNLSANALSSQGLNRILEPLMMSDIHETLICSSPLRQLQHLNLSFNELRSLPHCFHVACPSLCSLIIVGNFISNLPSVIKSLYPIRDTLTNIMVQESDRSSPNPICSLPLYRERMLRFLPNLQLIDGEHISETEKRDAAIKVESIIFEQQLSEEEELGCIPLKAKKQREKIVGDKSVVLLNDNCCEKEPYDQKTSKLRNLLKRKPSTGIENGSMRIPGAPGAGMGNQTNTEKMSSKRIDALESKMKQLRVVVEDQAKATKAILECDHQKMPEVKQQNVGDGIITRLDHVRFLVHQGCQVNTTLLDQKNTQSVEVQTEHAQPLINSEVQTATHPASKSLEVGGQKISITAFFSFRKAIQLRQASENELRSLTFYLWKSNTDALKMKDQVRKLHQYCKNFSLTRRKLKGALLESEEKLHSSEMHQGELQQKITHLLEEMEQQQQKTSTFEKKYISLLDRLKEVENGRADFDQNIKKMQTEIKALETQHLEECNRAEGLLVALGEYKLKCSSLQSDLIVTQQQLEKSKYHNEARIKEIEQENRESLKIARKEALEQYEKELSLTRGKADKQIHQVKQEYEEIVKRSTNDYEYLATERKALEETTQRLKLQVSELQSSLTMTKGQLAALEQENENKKEEMKSLKHVSEKVELRNRELSTALANSEKRSAHIDRELSKRKRSEIRRRVTSDRLREKIESINKEKAELERRCQRLICDHNNLNAELVELRNKFQSMASGIPDYAGNAEQCKERKSRERALKQVVKENQYRISSLERELIEKIEALRYCEGELVGLRCEFKGKESSLRHEFEKEITKMQQNEEAKSREYERRICLLEEECATAEERHLNAEVEVNSCKQQLRVELEARAMAEKEVDRLTRLLDDQVSRTKTALQSLLLQTGFYSS